MIFVIGEYVIDLVDDKKNNYACHLGGCGLNCAVACAKQGAPTAFISPISEDANGKKVLNYLIEKEILFEPDLCNTKAPSTLALATIEESGSAKYDFYLKNTASMVLSSEELLSALTAHTDIKAVHIASLSLLLNPTSSAIYDVLSFLNPRPVIFVDPNIRAQEVVKIINWKKKLISFFEIAAIIKLSDEDLEFIFEGLSQEEAIESLKKINPHAHIILTKGSQGATWYTSDNKIFNQKNYDVKVVDTIGSGDTFSGSLLAYLSKEGAFGDYIENPKLEIQDSLIKKALKYACYSASLNCAKNGCNPPSESEVLEIL
ncbi:MAG: carbohydrate kinase [Sphaerochaetaceae bacterium]|nr:carbohydrate kinase [Sphaerochaetaceae bacterium]